MLDRDGYRPSIAIVIANAKNQVFWGKRLREHSWQFPQGGIDPDEAPEEAMYRELWEEVGLFPQHVRILGRTRDWLRYHVPRQWVRREWRGSYRGQKQIWYLLRFVGRDSDINLRMTEKPEFDAWRWHDFQVPLDAVIEFKREVYKSALQELERFLYRRPYRRRGSGCGGSKRDEENKVLANATMVEDKTVAPEAPSPENGDVTVREPAV